MVLGDIVLPVFRKARFSGLQGIVQGDIIIDCTDMSLNTRKRVWSKVRKVGCRLLRVSYDGRGSTLVVSTGLPFMAPAAGGYVAIPSLALSFAAGGIGAEAVKRYIDNPVNSVTICISVEDLMKQNGAAASNNNTTP
jgi:hypothetical protein